MNQTLYYVWGCSHYQSSIDSRVMLRTTVVEGKSLEKHLYYIVQSWPKMYLTGIAYSLE